MKIKKNPKQNLENYSSVFTLLGLVLSLFITLIFMEQKTYASEKPSIIYEPATIKIDAIPSIGKVIKEKKKQPKIEKPKDLVEPVTKPIKAIDPTKFKKEKDDANIIEKPIATTDNPSDTPTDLKDIVYVKAGEEIGVETIDFISADNIPVFPGCEKYIRDKEKSKKCFNKNMSKFFGKNFDIGIAEDLNLTGMQRINCQFIINSQGKISPDIKTTQTHPELAREIKEVIKKLPKMIPAKQNGNPVNLIYMLPVRFYVD